jgi:hypothetical protein
MVPQQANLGDPRQSLARNIKPNSKIPLKQPIEDSHEMVDPLIVLILLG